MSSQSKIRLLSLVVFVSSLLMGVGYAKISSVYSGIEGKVLANVQEGIFITDVVYDTNQNADVVNSKIVNFYQTMLNSKIVLSSVVEKSSISYEVTIYNSTNDTYDFDGVTYDEAFYDNESIKFSLEGLEIGDELEGKSSVTFSITFYSDEILENNTLNCYLNFSFVYKEKILNGTDPIIKNNLLAVTIENDGTVKKADTSTAWYRYEEKIWANAIILKDESVKYEKGDVIPEDNIQSYFVWIPKYSYKLWDLGNYIYDTAVDDSKVHAIDIRFGPQNTTDSVEGECTTPGVSGEVGSCRVGDYMTHPAFLAFNTNGIWVGKFETGYDGATNERDARQDTTESSKVIIKPNVYSWRNIQVANAFTVSYHYQRGLDSHMMKNTEWGAVAYLSHSMYGINGEIRMNGNLNFGTGYASYSEMWNTEIGYLASTTGNITGIYDMSGGANEYVMGGSFDEVTSVANGIDSKYYDGYYYNVAQPVSKIGRILGDATGELGPFDTSSSWYSDYASFVHLRYSWFSRGGEKQVASSAIAGTGVFRFEGKNGSASANTSFRIVLSF